MDTIILILLVVLVLFSSHIKYAIRLWIYFKLNNAYGAQTKTRINNKPRKPARPYTR